MEIGEAFHSWTLLEKVPKPIKSNRTGKIGYQNTHGLFQCVCGHEQEVQLHSVKSGDSKMCRTCSLEKVRKRGRIPIEVGTKFGKWTFLGYANPPNVYKAIVVCECGTQKDTYTSNLTGGKTSCCSACAQNHQPEPLGELFDLWFEIAVLKRKETAPKWHKTATKFMRWAKKNGWKEGMKVYRINENELYSMQNCLIK